MTDPSGCNPLCAWGLAGGPPGWGAAAACAALWAVGAYVVSALAVEVGKAAAEQCDRTDCLNGLTPPRRSAPDRIDAGAAPAPPRHTGNHTPAPVTPPSSPHPAPQDVPRGGNIQGTPWELDESLVCTQEGFPMPEAEDFKVTIFPAPEKGEVPVLMSTNLNWLGNLSRGPDGFLRPSQLLTARNNDHAEQLAGQFVGVTPNGVSVRLPVPGTRRRTAPDLIHPQFLGEVKFFDKTRKLAANAQQKDTAAVAIDKGIPYYVFTTEGTEIMPGLKTLVESTGGEVIYLFERP